MSAPSLAAAGVPAAPQSLAEILRSAPTPRRLKAFMYAIWAVAGLLFLLGEGSVTSAHQAMQTVGKDTAPSIIAAQEIGSALADLDANAGNYLLGEKKHQIEATETFEKQRLVVTQSLVKAAKNITYDAEYKPINELVEHLGRYLQHYGEVRYRKDSGDAAGAFTAYSSASEMMHKTMLPAAAALDELNYSALKREYEKQQARSEVADIVAGLVAAALVAVLVWSQVFLAQDAPPGQPPALRGHPGGRRLRGVPRPAHQRRPRGSARRQGGRLRVDPRPLAGPGRRLRRQRRRDPLPPRRAPGPDVRAGLQGQGAEAHQRPPARRGDARRRRSCPASYKGYFADELRNITFPGEGEAALKMIRAFAAYDKVDGQIRALERGGKHAEAVQLCIGSGVNESNATFERFDTALQQVIAINHTEFDATIDAGMGTLSTAGKILPVASLIIAFLALFGIRPRLREYAA